MRKLLQRKDHFTESKIKTKSLEVKSRENNLVIPPSTEKLKKAQTLYISKGRTIKDPIFQFMETVHLIPETGSSLAVIFRLTFRFLNFMEELLFYLPFKAVKKDWELNNGKIFPKITFGLTKIEGFKNTYDAVNLALACGYRSFDCSPRNNEEENLGKALEELLPLHNLQRKDITLCSKVIPKNYGKHLTRESFTQSCQNLKTDYIDIFLMEWPGGFKIDPESSENVHIRAETWNEIAVLNSTGHVKAAGVCHFNPRHLESIRKKSRLTPAVNQVEFHPQCPQTELLKYCNDRNIQLMAACHKDTVNPLLLEEPAVKKVADDLKKSPTQIVLKWILNKGVGVVVQSTNKNKIAENFDLFEFILGKNDMDLLNGIHTRERYLRSPVAVM